MSAWRLRCCIFINFLLPFSLEYGLYKEKADTLAKFVAQEDVWLYHKRVKTYGENYGKTWVVMADGNGDAQFAMISPNHTHSPGKMKSKLKKCSHIRFYTKEQPEGVKFMVKEKTNYDLYDFDRPTKIIIHGWRGSSEAESVTLIKDEFLRRGDHNIITYDWRVLAKDVIYSRAAAATKVAGQILASLIDDIVYKLGISYLDFHLIGFSLGAHVAGLAGRYAKKKVRRITGLDPSKICFEGNSSICGSAYPFERLRKSDAELVDVIHSCAGVAGFIKPIGHIDFYPNGGSPFQPGCCLEQFPPLSQACSHAKAYKLFAESIWDPNFKAKQCANYDHFQKNNCRKVYQIMGEGVIPTVEGIFYLRTNRNRPFAMGLNGTLPKV